MITKKEMVVQSNRIVEASYRLSLVEQRIILYAIYLLREQEKSLFDGMPVYIDAKGFCLRFPDTDPASAYKQLSDAIDVLYNRSITFYDADADGDPRGNKVRWIYKSSYVDNKGRIEMTFTPDVVKHITRLESEFTSYDLVKVSRMTSANAVRIFQLLMQYKTVGKRELKLKELREALMVADDEYKLTANFMLKVLDVAVKQINAHTDIKVSYEPTKDSRKIDGFIFKIKDKTKPEAKPKKPADQADRDKLEAMGQTRIDDFDPDEEF